jgi:PTH1 family peptidyl-tRNA hydrolase
VPLSELLVVYDDIDIPFGKMRLRPSGTSGGHKGMKSIIASLGTDAFPRLRLGIQGKAVPANLTDYVLGEFTPEEEAELEEIIERACQAIKTVVSGSFEIAMSQFNS